MNYNNYINPYNNYGYPMQNNYGVQPNYSQPQYQSTNTNKIFVSGIEEAKRYPLPANSNVMLLDNDKSIAYEKIVDSAGKYEVNMYQLSKINDLQDTKDSKEIDLSSYVLKSEFDRLESEIKDIKDLFKNFSNKTEKKEYVIDGTN